MKYNLVTPGEKAHQMMQKGEITPREYAVYLFGDYPSLEDFLIRLNRFSKTKHESFK